MKVICISGASSLSPTAVPGVRIGADSSLQREGDPLFLPDHLGKWQAAVCPAVRICRLGTNIPLKAAQTYYDSLTLVSMLLPEGVQEPLPDIYGLMDRAFIPGKWIPYGPDRRMLSFEASLSVASRGSEPEQCSNMILPGGVPGIETAISAISRYATLKMGDIIVLTDHRIAYSPRIDSEVTGLINGEPCLGFRIK